MRDDEWQAAYNAGRDSVAGLVELAERLGGLDDLIARKDGPHRVYWQGEWHEGPMANAFILIVQEVSSAARTALEKYRSGQ